MKPEPGPRLRAECPSCGKRYRVPNARQPWTCKACGEVLAVHAPPAAEERRAAAGEVDRRPATAAGRRRASTTALRERGTAERELRKASRVIGVLRLLFGFNLVLAGISLLLGLVLLGNQGGSRPEVLVMVAGGGLAAAFALAGLLDVRRHPFGWAVTLLVMRVLSDISKIVEGDLGVTGWTLVLVGEGLVWYCAIEADRLKRLLAAHPDTRVAKRLRGEPTDAALGMDPAESIGRRRTAASRHRARQETSRTAWIAAGLVIALVAVVSFVQLSGGPEDPKETFQAFAEAWTAGDLDAMSAHFPPGSQEKLARSLERPAEQRGWSEAGFPPVEEIEWASDGKRTEAFLHTPEGALRTRWRWEDGRWVLGSIAPPRGTTGG